MWPSDRLQKLFNIDIPILQAPMAAAGGVEMAVAVSSSGGLGALPCAMLSPQVATEQIAAYRKSSNHSLNLNFFAHEEVAIDPAQQHEWQEYLRTYFEELNVELPPIPTTTSRKPFDDAMCALIEQNPPEVVSFHFGLPNNHFMQRIRAAGCKIIATATTVDEAVWLEAKGVDAIIAQGVEAGGHRGLFLTEDISRDVASQPGLFALLPQVVDAVSIPVIATGGIGDARAIAAALVLGADGVQLGTAFLLTPEATISQLHADALRGSTNANTQLTNLFSGRPARGLTNRLMQEIGPMSAHAPGFPTAGETLAPLKAAAEALNRHDFSSLWAGQAAPLCQELPAAELTKQLAEQTQAHLLKMARP